LLSNLAPIFSEETTEFQVPHGHYMVMGDNTMSSYDSRGWGPFPQENVIGRSWFVYWPIGRQEGRENRFGTTNRRHEAGPIWECLPRLGRAFGTHIIAHNVCYVY